MSSAPDQIALALAGKRGLNAIHIIAHGRRAEVCFAAGALSLDTLNAHRASLAAIGRALADHGDLLLWSCDTGRGQRGSDFVDALSRATGAAVFSATRLVGAALRGGNWALEPHSECGRVIPPLTTAGQVAYQGVMGKKAWKGGSGSWSTSGNWSPNGIPSKNDDVQISGSGYTVTLDVDTVTLGSLTINNTGATLAIGNHVLNVTGSANGVTDAVSLTNGHITMAGGTINAKSLSLGSSTDLVGYGILQISVGTAGNGVLRASGGILDVYGSIGSPTAGVNLQIANVAGSVRRIQGLATAAGPIAISHSTQVLEITETANVTILGGSENITNGIVKLKGGTLTDTAGVTIGLGAQLQVNSNGGSTLNGGSGGTTISGTLSVTGGNLNVTGNLTVTGTGNITIGSGATLNTTGTLINNSGGQIAVTGTLHYTGTLTNNGSIVTTSGVFVDPGSLFNNGSISGTVSLTGGGYLDNTATGQITGSPGLAAVSGSGGPATVVNAGVIGYINLTAGGGVTNQLGGFTRGVQVLNAVGTVGNAGSISSATGIGI